MGGDYTRFTFDPIKEFSGVRKQQGRVSLDSDFNEFEAILDRRRRAQMHDTVGSVGRAVIPVTTPHGFKVGLSGTQLTIGAGRAYVDGILAECFGDMGPSQPTNQDDVLGGIRGAGPLPFDKQPFYHTFFPGLLSVPNAINTVYLDVWQREVTVFEDEALREPALNGPDTATRVQTAWQVKVMSRPATSSNCAATPAGWDKLIAPSTARLTAKADGVLAPPPGPCEINPAGGYTGLENRLYRVEIHSAGTVGATNTGSGVGPSLAQFKWSRDNASLAARVIAATRNGTEWTITVSSIGPDEWTRFDQGDHIELLDDDDEFAMRDRGHAGRMMKVTSVDHANHVIVAQSPSVGAFTARPERHPRIRRWDAASATEPTLRPVVAGVAVPLEHGISITFDGSNATLNAGDYWVFEARTATGSIGTLVNAPPRGPLHHFAKLGYVTVGQTPTDCRVFWPPPFGGGTGESCCTVVVKPGDDIQSAIDSLAGKGGCVCLKMGVHTIPQPLQIHNQDNVTLHAEAPLVTVRLDSGGPLMLSIGADNVSVLGIHFQARDGAKGGGMIELDDVDGGRIADCALSFIDPGSPQHWDTIGIRMNGCHDYTIENNALSNFVTGIEGQECGGVTIAGNRLTGPSFVQLNKRQSAGQKGIVFTDTVGIDVEHNRLSHYLRGIAIGDMSLPPPLKALELGDAGPGCRIVANVITHEGGTPPDNAVVDFTQVTSIAYAIAVRMPRCEIVENAVRLDIYGDVGILADGGNVLFARNLLSSTAVFASEKSPYLIPRGVVAAVHAGDAFICAIRDNLFTGLQLAIVAAGTDKSSGAVRRVDIASNHVAGSANLFKVMAALAKAVVKTPQDLLNQIKFSGSIVVSNVKCGRVADNEISTAVWAVVCGNSAEVVVEGNAITSSLGGVVLGISSECDVADNVIDGVAMGIVLGDARTSVVQRNVISQTPFGIFDLIGTGTRIQDNDLSGGALGIELMTTADAEVRGNSVQDASLQGIGALPMKTVALAHNTVRRCGYQKNVAATAIGKGIGVIANDAVVLIESCQALDVGVSSEATDPIFKGKRFGITINSVHARARVHGCTITSPSIASKDGGPGANPASRALLISAGQPRKPTGTPSNNAERVTIQSQDGSASVDYADAADNLAEQTATPVVEIVTEGEIIFSANRCRLLDSSPGNAPVVSLAGSCIVANSNRVRSQGGGPSLELMASRALTAVGNATTTDANISGVQELPAPYGAFNVRT